MPAERKTTQPNPEALAALVERMAWFFARRDVEQRQARQASKRAKTRRRAPAARA
jgi:hypothetical protein